MRHSAKRIRQQRAQMDRRLQALRPLAESAKLPNGWLRAIREGLGMSSAELGRRLGIAQGDVVRMEQREARGAIALETLERAAAAMGCRVVYAVVPETSLEEMVVERSRQAARRLMGRVTHTMALESQQPDADVLEEQVEELAKELREKARPEVWEEP